MPATTSRERVDLLLDLRVHGRDRGAAHARPVQVLERREQRRDARLLVRLGPARREWRGDAGVVHHVARRDVRVQGLWVGASQRGLVEVSGDGGSGRGTHGDEGLTVWWACAGNELAAHTGAVALNVW